MKDALHSKHDKVSKLQKLSDINVQDPNADTHFFLSLLHFHMQKQPAKKPIAKAPQYYIWLTLGSATFGLYLFLQLN